MKRTILAVLLLTSIFSTLLFTESPAKAENNKYQGDIVFIYSNSPDASGMLVGPQTIYFTTDKNGFHSIEPPPQTGYYCICVAGTGGGCIGSVYINGAAFITVTNGASCSCSN